MRTVDLIIHAGKPSRGSIAMLIAAAANPTGHMNIGQVSPTRRLSDFQKKYPNGTNHARREQMATAYLGDIPPRRQRRARQDHRQQDKPTSPNCKADKIPDGANDNSWVAVARTNWNRNDAQSC